MTSFHWSLTQFAGSMEVMPATTAERTFAVVVLVAAYIVSAVFLSFITSSMTRLNMISGKEASMFKALQDYLLDRGISRKLMMRVQRNANHALVQSRQNCPEKDIELLHLISEPLRMEIHFELHVPVLQAHPLFRRIRDDNPALVRKLSHSAVCTLGLWPGDLVFAHGEVKQPPEMYFIMKGTAEYKQAFGITEVEVGAWVAEQVLWCEWAHQGLLNARTECELLVLNADLFRTIARQIGNPNLNLGRYAGEYVKSMNIARLTDSRLSDLDADEHGKSSALEALYQAFDFDRNSKRGGGNLRSVMLRKANSISSMRMSTASMTSVRMPSRLLPSASGQFGSMRFGSMRTPSVGNLDRVAESGNQVRDMDGLM